MKIVVVSVLLLLSSLVVNVQQSPAPANPAAPQTQPVLTLQQFLDQFLLIVAPIEIWSGPTRLGTATGFFFVNEGRLYFVTNRHVVRLEQNQLFPDRLAVRLHTNRQDHTQNANYSIQLYQNKTSTWREEPGVDLVAIELPREDMSRYEIVSMGTDWFPPDNLVIAPGDEVMVIGYPLGFYDTLHNYPILRTGAVASAYPVPFQGQPLFLVDARLAPGTSGSPVITKPSSIQRTSTATMFGSTSVYFLGVNSAEVNTSGVSTELNTIWYGKEVKTITDPSFKTATFPEPEAKKISP